MAHRISPDMVKFSRLAMCIIGPCTQMLRDILSVKVQPATLRNYVTLANLKLNYEQKQQLNSGTVPDYANFDISFLYLLLRTPGMCRPPVTPPTNGWGKPPSSKSQVTLGDDIERLRIMKNDICSHIKKPELTQKEFDDTFADLKAIASRVDAFLAPSADYVKELDEMETENMEKEVCQYYLDEIRNMKKHEKDVMEKFSDVKENINSLHLTTNQINDKLDETLHKIDTLSNEAKVQKENINSLHLTTNQINDKLDGTLQKMDTLSNEAKVQKGQEDAFLQKIQQDDKLFVESKASKLALDTLEMAKVISIIGITGQGKTALSRHIAIKFREKGYRILNVRSAKEFETKCNPKQRTICLMDDAFGKKYKIQYEIDSWLRHIDDLTDWSQEYDMYFIYTSQKVVWNECQPYLRPYTIFHSRNVIDLTAHNIKLTKKDKIQMLRMHLKARKRQMDEMMVQEITEIETPIGFPYCCSSFSSNDELYALGSDYFRNTKTALQTEFQSLCESEIHKEKFCVLLSVMVLDNCFPGTFDRVLERDIGDKVRNILLPFGIELDKNIVRLNKALKDLEGTYLQEQKNEVSFIHDAYIDAMCIVSGKRNQSIILQNCSADFFHQYIRIDDDPNKTNDDITIFTAASSKDLLGCVIRLLKCRELHLVFENPVFNNKEFIEQLRLHVDRDPNSFIFMADQVISDDENMITVLEYCIETTRPLLVTFAIFCFKKFNTISVKCKEKIKTSRNECLCIASRHGVLEAVEELLDIGADIAYKSPKSHNLDALLWSAAGGHLSVLQLLIKRGANVNTVDAKQQTAIHHLLNCSKYEDYLALVEMLIDNAADIDKKDVRGVTVKELIMTKFNEENAAFLLAKEMKRRVGISEVLKYYPHNVLCRVDKTVLHIANKSSLSDKTNITTEDITMFVRTYEMLQNCHVNVNEKDNIGKTPLFYAAESMNPLSLFLLCCAGADVNITDNEGKTALHYLMIKWNESNFENPVTAIDNLDSLQCCADDLLWISETFRQFVREVCDELLRSTVKSRITTDDLWDFCTPEMTDSSERVFRIVWYQCMSFFIDVSSSALLDKNKYFMDHIPCFSSNVYDASCSVMLAYGANICEGSKKMDPKIYLQSDIKKQIYTSISKRMKFFNKKLESKMCTKQKNNLIV